MSGKISEFKRTPARHAVLAWAEWFCSDDGGKCARQTGQYGVRAVIDLTIDNTQRSWRKAGADLHKEGFLAGPDIRHISGVTSSGRKLLSYWEGQGFSCPTDYA